jgi:hypothetical protein
LGTRKYASTLSSSGTHHMKKLLLIAALALGISGCANFPTSVDVNTAVSRNTLYGVVNGYGLALSAEQTYKNLCIQGSADKNCRATVARMQAADVRAVSAIAAANDFIKKYPTVNAGNLVQAATDAVNNFKQVTGTP